MGECGDRVESVDGQLAQELQVAAFGAEALEQERGVLDGQFGPAVDTAGVAVGRDLALGKLLVHPCRIGTGPNERSPLPDPLIRRGRRRRAPPPTCRRDR